MATAMKLRLKIILHGVLVAGLPMPVCAQLLSGTAEAVDGDSLIVGAQRIRLFGIYAPELDQSCVPNDSSWQCGEQSRQMLSELVTSQRVDCRITGMDQYGRNIGVCSTEFLTLNEAMVELGWAVAYREYSQDYIEAEERAKVRKTGIWGSTFTMPSQHRLAHNPKPERPGGSDSLGRAQNNRHEATNVVSRDCRIKGNRNRKGQWIYHLPGMPYYDVTRAEEFFCSEAEARAAGYRRAIVR